MDLINGLQIFIRVVETGSFSAVARESNASQSAVTRQVAQLEDHFGVRLFHRTTRKLSLTDDGQDLVNRARHLLEEAEDLLDLDLAAGIGEKVNDPVRMYLREMGTVPLLTREGEVEIARRIERGQNTMLKSLSLADASVHFLHKHDGDRMKSVQDFVGVCKECTRDYVSPAASDYVNEQLIVELYSK